MFTMANCVFFTTLLVPFAGVLSQLGQWLSLPCETKFLDFATFSQLKKEPVFGHPAQNSITHAVKVSEHRRNLWKMSTFLDAPLTEPGVRGQ